MNRLALPLALVLTTLLSGCAMMDYLPDGKRHVYTSPTGSAQRVESGGSVSSGSVADRAYDPKTQPYTVMGRTYYPLPNASGYDERGVASWYGRDFHGKATASGDIYDMNGLTAAHKTLPLGTVVRVTNLHNGRSVDLLVNDRGPFVDGRIIDLSYGAARRLGSAVTGLAQVRVQAVGIAGDRPMLAAAETPAARPAATVKKAATVKTVAATTDFNLKPVLGPDPTPTAAPAVADGGGYYVQVGAFSVPDNARKVLDNLKRQGYRGSHIEVRQNGGSTLHVVKAGAFDALPGAKRALGDLKTQFPSSFIVS